eukprot:gb/GEZN01000496.1/.p1 GENE.gb/GEZN01000496.1/~~gb/GEZN01000496.1/.p1  ORF type:complete len:1402 (+),score=195.44 gb/GEZN01000496.1/:39-4244(+)
MQGQSAPPPSDEVQEEELPELKRPPSIKDELWELVEALEPAISPRPEVIPGRWRTVRIFISSTFVDMHGERDCLIHEVFPEINNLVKSLYIRVIPVDLRWGVSQEETATIQTTCLDEIDRCRSHELDLPWFIGLRGERYGWVQESYTSPLQFAHPLNLQWLKRLDNSGKNLSITSMEVYHAFTGPEAMQHGAASTIYTVPHSFFCFRKTDFEEVVPADRKWIFEFEFKDPTRDRVDEENKLQYTVTARSRSYYKDKLHLDQAIKASTLPRVILEYPCSLDKTEITGQLPTGRRFGCGWVGGLSQFRDTLINQITRSIQLEYEAPGDLDSDQKESAFHASLIADRAEGFLGREELVAQALGYCTGLEEKKEIATVEPMVLVGAPGCGKSAVIARICQLMQERKNKDTVFIPHLVGASTDSVYVRKLLMRLCQLLKRNVPGAIAEDVSDDYVILCAQFQSILAKAASQKQVVIVIDAINQLSPDNKAHRMKWLPAVLPPNARILLSTLEFENDTFANTLAQFPKARVCRVGVLTQNEQSQLVSRNLARYHKKLTTDDKDKFLGNQMEILLNKEQAHSPLYLVLLCDALRRFGVYEKLTEYIRSLPATLPKLFSHVLNDLEEVHGKELTRAAMALIAVSRGGLMETEVNACLERMDLGSRISNFARIYGQTYNYFAAGGSGYLKFFHDQLLYVTRERYAFGGVSAGSLDLAVHGALAGYFLQVVNRQIEGAQQYNIEHATSEVVFHLVHSEQWDNIIDLLSRMDFIVLSLHFRTLADLVTDYGIFLSYAEEHLPASLVEQKVLEQIVLIRDALKMSADKVRVDIKHTPYQLWCRLNGALQMPLIKLMLDTSKWTQGLADQAWSLVGEGMVAVPQAEDLESKSDERKLDVIRPPAAPPIPIFTTGYNRPGGALQYEVYCEGSGCGQLVPYADKINDCLSALAYTSRGEKNFLQTSVLNLDAGVVLALLTPPTYSQTLQDTRSHLFLDDNKSLLTFGHNGTMNLWDLTNTAKAPQMLQYGHNNCTVWMHWTCESVTGVCKVTESPEDPRLLSYGNRGKLVLWDRISRQPQFLRGHTGDGGGGRDHVYGVYVFREGTRALSWGTNQIILWDLTNKQLLAQRQGMVEWASNGPWVVVPAASWRSKDAAAVVCADKFDLISLSQDKIETKSWDQRIGIINTANAEGDYIFVAGEHSVFTFDLNEHKISHFADLKREVEVGRNASPLKKDQVELGLPSRQPHRYWRIAAFEGGKNWNIKQIQFFEDAPKLFEGTNSTEQATPGKVGATTTGGQPFSTSNYPGHPPSYAFDGTISNNFAFNQDERPMGIGWDFGAGNEKDIRRLRFMNGRDFDQVPEVTVQWSDDGKSWQDDWKMKINNYTEQRGKIWDERQRKRHQAAALHERTGFRPGA